MTYPLIKEKCLKDGCLFEDADFPAEMSSLIFSKKMKNALPTVDVDKVEWKHPHELCENPQFTVEGAGKHDLDQGKLGNCWFVASAATLSDHPDLFERVVPLDQCFDSDYCGAFRFNFWRYGEWVEVVIDDRLPTIDNKLIFCQNRESKNEFWSSLLEKAYAKVFGSYQALVSGSCYEALVDFTGGIGEELRFAEYPLPRKLKLFPQLKQLIKQNTLLCAAIYAVDGAGELTENTGLIARHAYSITDLATVDLTNGEKICLIRIRNPHGTNEWTGDWSDSSSKWELVPQEMVERFDLKILDDGEYWMSFTDFITHFHAVHMCHLIDSPKKNCAHKKDWNIETYEGEWVKGVTAGGGKNNVKYFLNPQYFCVLDKPDEGNEEGQCTLIVSLMQKYSRMRKTLEKWENTNLVIGFDLWKYNGKLPEELDGFTAQEKALCKESTEKPYTLFREVSHMFSLDPGTYCVIPNTGFPDLEGPFMLRMLTQVKTKSGEVGNQNDAPEMPVKKRRKFDELFDKHSREDSVMDAQELRKLLNEGLLKNKEEDFSKETCRELIQSITGERQSLLDRGDSKMVWKKLKQLQEVFSDYGVDNSGRLDGKELRNAFRSLGYKLGKKTQGNIVKKYCDRKNHLSLDDFVLVTQKMTNSKELFNKIRRRKHGEVDASTAAEVEVTCDEFMEMNI